MVCTVAVLVGSERGAACVFYIKNTISLIIRLIVRLIVALIVICATMSPAHSNYEQGS